MTSEILSRLAAVEGVMFDVDGCLVISDGPAGQEGSALPGAAELIAQMRASGRRVCVFTNGTAQPPAEIAAHLGEVLWQQGKREEARKVWAKGREKDADNETLAETVKRLDR